MDQPGTGCMCCTARTCLIAWSTFSVVVGAINLIVGFADGTANFHDGNTVSNLIGCIIIILVNLFVLFAAVSRSRQMLKVAFWVIIADIVVIFILMILAILFISNVFGSTDIDNEGGVIAFVIVFYLIVMGVQGLLAWTIKRTVNEINITKGQTQPATNTYTTYMT